jgi:hypothetical protein
LTNKETGAYTTGGVAGAAWNIDLGVGCGRALLPAAPNMAASSVPEIAYIGRTMPAVNALKGSDVDGSPLVERILCLFI